MEDIKEMMSVVLAAIKKPIPKYSEKYEQELRQLKQNWNY